MPWPKGKKCSPEMRENLTLGRELAQTPEAREKRKRTLMGRKRPPFRLETIEKMKAVQRARFQDPTQREEMLACLALGVEYLDKRGPRSPKAREKQSCAMKRCWAKPDSPMRTSESLLQRKESLAKRPPVWRSKLEVVVAGVLQSMGLNVRHNVSVKGLGRHQWDLVLDNLKTVVEVDGCFWHGCRACGFEGPQGVKEKDAEHTAAAKAAGWRVVRITEHEVNRGDFSVLQSLKVAA